MEVREGLFHGSGQVDIEAAVHFGWQAGLHADFGCTHVNCFFGSPNDLLLGEEVPFFLAVLPAERAERAMFNAHIGEVDIPVDDIGYHLTDLAATHFVGNQTGGVKIDAIGLA